MEFAINLLALIIVLGLCWGAMMWLGGRFHGHGSPTGPDAGSTNVEWFATNFAASDVNEPCVRCEGVGASTARGKLSPCPECLGTGVLR